MLLIGAMKNTRNVEAARNAYQAQYWQYAQQQQAYQQNMMPSQQAYGAAPAYGAEAYNAPPAATTAAPPQTGWQWPGQMPGSTRRPRRFP